MAAAAALPAARLESLRALSALFREAQPRETAEESVFRNVLEILTSTSSAIEQTCKDSCGLADLDTCLLLAAECFRCLRNACVECAKNQHVMRNLGLISTSVHLIKLLHGIQIKEELLLTESTSLLLLDSRMEVCLHQLLHFLAFAIRTWKDHGSKLPQIVLGEVHSRYQGKFLRGKDEQALEWAAQGGSGVTILEVFTKALRCSLQFLGNIAAGNGDSQNSIWKCAFPDLFLTCLTYSDEKIVTYCCMVLFTCLNSERVRELLDPGNLTVALHVLRAYKEQLDSEWSFLIVTEHLMKCPELVKVLYAKLSNQERITLLELMMVKVSDKNSVSSEEMNVFVRHADFLAVCFQEKCGAVLKLTAAADVEDEEALVTIRLLDVLCEMTSNNSQLEHLQAFPGLLETAVDTLRLTHLAGKQAVNIFTATHAVTGQEEISHPAVGFKSHLIRLIGNLCYKNKENQDKVYDMDGISLILDNCSIDDNNPCSAHLDGTSPSQPRPCFYGITIFLLTVTIALLDKIYLQFFPLALWICSFLLECGDFLKDMQPFPEIVDRIVANSYFAKQIVVVSQWAVYAIRNLTEQNEQNQALIAQMEQKGLADSSALERMGLEIQQRDDKLILRSVRKKPS